MKLVLATCVLAACSQTENLGDRFALHAARWSLSLGTSASSANGYLVTVDSDGDVVASGAATGPVDFGMSTVGTLDVVTHWVSKRSGVDGSEQWTHGLVGTNFGLSALTTDHDRDVIIGGGYTGPQDFGGKTLSGAGQDAFVAMYNPDGQLRWVAGLASGSGAYADSVVVAGDRIFMSARSPTGGFVAAYDLSGQQQWVISVPVGGHLQVAPDGRVVFAGVVPRSSTLGSTTIDLTHDPDLFVTTVSPSSDISNVSTFGVPGVAHRDLYSCMTSGGDLAATANEFDLSTSVPDEVLVDAAGGTRWTASPTSPAQSWAIAALGDIVITGGHVTGRSFDNGGDMKIGAMYLAARDRAGHLVDSRVFGDPTLGGAANAFTALAVGPGGELAFTGYVDQAVDFGTGQLPAPTSQTNLVLGVISEP